MKRVGILVVGLSVLLAACSSKPSLDDVQNEYASTNADCPGMKLANLKKVNGENGVDEQHYALEVSYDLEIPDVESICREKNTNDLVRIGFMQLAQQKGVKFENGMVLPIQETKRMKKTENGWVFDSE